jgi:cell division transport system ATP-binding protein
MEDYYMVEFRDVTKLYSPTAVALDCINFKIEDGEFVFLVGKTGAGKSSAIKLLTGEIKPTSGDVIIDGIYVNSLRRSKIPYLRRAQGVVFQDFRLLPNKTVYENVAFAMEIIGKKKKEIKRKVPKILELVGLSERAKNYPNEISGGEQQRVSIARALVNSPSLIIADEPTGNLDVETSNEVMKLFDEINKMGTTIVMVTHSEKIVNDMKKRVIQLENGSIVRDEKEGVYNLGV